MASVVQKMVVMSTLAAIAKDPTEVPTLDDIKAIFAEGKDLESLTAEELNEISVIFHESLVSLAGLFLVGLFSDLTKGSKC